MEYPFKDLLPLDEVLEREGYYRDWTHLDPEVFYSLTQISDMIKTKGFGSDVRLLMAQLAEHFGLSVVEITDIANNLIARQSAVENRQDAVEDFNNQVIQEMTDKDVISAPEIIAARGGKPTLQARLDDTTAQLAQAMQQISQQQEGNLINILRKHSILDKSIYVKRSGTTLIIAVFFDTENAVEYHMRVDNDGWWRKREAFVKKFKKKEINGSLDLHTDMDNFTESDWFGSAPTRYTTIVGAEFSGTFEGSGLFFNSTTDNRGGVWEFTIDGLYKRLISTWSASYVWTRAQLVIDGLEYGEHTYTAKFIGEDSERTYTETARGHANYNPNYPTSSTLKTISPIIPTLEEVGVGFEIGDSVSIDEFAFSVKPASSSYDSNWVPAHSGTSGIMKDVEKSILIDGEDIINDVMTYPTIYRPVKSVRFITNYKAYHPNNASPLWDGRIDQNINTNGFFVSGKMKFLQNITIENGYTAMYPAKRSTTGVDTLVTSKGLRLSFGEVGTETVIPNYPSEVVLFSENGNESQRKLAIGLGIYDASRSLNSNHWGSKQFVSHRGDDTDKLYFRPYQGVNAMEGEVYNFNTELFITQIEEVSDILS